MKPIPASKNDRSQSIPILWAPLPESQQEMLSGGAPSLPRLPLPRSLPGSPGAPSGTSNGELEV